VFATVSHFHPSLIFGGKAYEPTLKVNSLQRLYRGRLWRCPQILHQGEVTNSDKHSSLLQYGLNYSRNDFRVQALREYK